MRYSLIITIIIVLGAIFVSGCLDHQDEQEEEIPWNLTLTDGESTILLSMEDIRALKPVTGHAYAVSTVGIRYGPYRVKGVDILDLLDLIGGAGENDLLYISAPDGYLWVFDTEQASGSGFLTFNTDLKEIPSPPLRVIIAYEQDGKPLTYNDGGPLRLIITSDTSDVITEGSSWVKWVDRIEIRRR
ncbi:molybdopterin-binding oxidoreductase [Methanocalculus chunghsingensis]|uniref:Molybdopterin-binding oxidoreductase n=1 Tax=Methanocalculus chunghsingensis TaxID=156457 RepID=A0A8J7W835_9EURY|nr:molybdopterin-dependent oxidoreductase [Methanocalculus chunghsingensis]MBR1368045.1 molybdopterin-binding oxidoreductase [Methanocalculus chunghsingensis]